MMTLTWRRAFENQLPGIILKKLKLGTKMVSNKKIRMTKPSPFVLELIGCNIMVTVIGILFMLLTIFSATLSGNNSVCDILMIAAIIGGMIQLSPLGMYFTAHNTFLQAVYLRKKSKSQLKTDDVVLFACGNDTVAESNYGYTTSTLLKNHIS